MEVLATPLSITNENKKSVVRALDASSSLFFGWFSNSFWRVSNDKSHPLINCIETNLAIVDGSTTELDKTEVLGITIDYELKYDKHINHLCIKILSKL